MSYTDLIREAKEAVVTIRNLKAAEAALAQFALPKSHTARRDITLKRLKPFMPQVGNPQDQLRVIHVAGTSGKTSTAYYIAALLAAAGQKTGLAVSPHVDTITERIQINGRNISDADFCRELGVFLDIVCDIQPRLSHFELLHAFTLWVMARQKVDYLVIETGVGGLHDATNINARPDKVCVITDIGFDHMDLLGKTLPAIASQKIGIVHEHNHVFMYEQAEEIMIVVEAWVKRHDARLHLVRKNTDGVSLPSTMPGYQQRNWHLAYAVYRYLAERDSLPNVTRQVLAKTQALQVPGRMDSRTVNGKTLVMDGAHNAQKIQAFIESFRQLYPNVKPAILIGLKEGKDYQTVAPLLAPLAGRIITTDFRTAQDMPVVSMDTRVLAEAFQAAGAAEVRAVSDNRAAFRALLDGPEAVCVITGSIYLLGQIRNNEGLA